MSEATSRGRDGTAVAVLLGGSVTIMIVLPLFLVGALAVQLRADLGLTIVGLGTVVAISRAATALSSVAVGLRIDRISSSLGLRLAAALSATSMIGIALTARNTTTLTLWLLLSGVSFAFGQTAVNRFLSTAIPSHRRGVAFGIKQSSVPTATLLAGIAVPTIAVRFGWQYVFLAAGVLGVVIVLAIPRAESTTMVSTAAAMTGPRPPVRSALLFALGFGLSMAGASPLGVFLVDHAVATGFDPGRAGLILALGSGASIAMRLSAGRAADRRDTGHLRWVASMVMIGVLGFVLLATEVPLLMVIGAVVAFAFGWGFNGLFWYAVLRAHPAAPGALTGMVTPGGLVGGLAGPLIYGLVADAFSYRIAWLGAGLLAASGSLAMLACARMVERAPATSPGTERTSDH